MDGRSRKRQVFHVKHLFVKKAREVRPRPCALGAEERFAAAWGGCEALAPGDGARTAVRRAFGLASLIDNEYH